MPFHEEDEAQEISVDTDWPFGNLALNAWVEVADRPLHTAEVSKNENFRQVLADTVLEDESLQSPRWVALP
jgi:hypothetical protein